MGWGLGITVMKKEMTLRCVDLGLLTDGNPAEQRATPTATVLQSTPNLRINQRRAHPLPLPQTPWHFTMTKRHHQRWLCKPWQSSDLLWWRMVQESSTQASKNR